MNTLKRVAALALLATLTLNAVHAHAAATAPDLRPTAIAIDENGFIKVRVSNLGTAAGPSKVRVWHYRSSQILDMAAVPACTYGTPFLTTNIKLEAGWPVFVWADVLNEVQESDEANSCSFPTR